MGKLIRDLKEGVEPGLDIFSSKRVIYKFNGDTYSWNKLINLLPSQKNKFTSSFTTSINKARKKIGWPPNGLFNNLLLERLRKEDAVDAYSDKLYEDYAKQQATKLIEPYQGWSSLHKSLWQSYSIGRNMGLEDGPGKASGTYNPASRLPSGAPSDHAILPAYAYDLDIVEHTGWNNLNARAFFYKVIARPETHYAILGTKIWSTEKGLYEYTGGGHADHIHVSGKR